VQAVDIHAAVEEAINRGVARRAIISIARNPVPD
jgi:hypothetical protein